jgi:hypothetical protein
MFADADIKPVAQSAACELPLSINVIVREHFPRDYSVTVFDLKDEPGPEKKKTILIR